ncbi:MAG: hypothetical protein NC253_04610 [Ruminococcus sp.]|nr:hypothetical protein [Ruminococcus sp.]MCM1381382.1 hypothetical protein [Muribaculaceae bacterium]MCM1479283.1 hypothetical protein [Muribaculaceae bacterium]
MCKKFLLGTIFSLAILLTACSKGGGEVTENISETSAETVTVTETPQTSKTTEAETTAPQPEETVPSETLLKVDYDMVPILERPLYSEEPSPMEMPEGMEFTLNLKDITPETDLSALTNMEKHNVGETFKIDLDLDGTEEEISVEEDFYDCEGVLRVLRVVINGTSYNLDRSHEGFINVPTGIFTCDIDSSDSYIDIACTGSIAANDFLTKFYRYENGELRRIFEISYDTPDGNGEAGNFFDEMNASVTGKPIITDGSGVITAARRLDTQTWLAYSHYAYDSESGEISLVCEPVYPYYYENIGNFAAAKEFSSEYYNPENRNIANQILKEETALYKEPDLSSEAVTAEPQECYITAEYFSFDGAWVYLSAKDGKSGWCCINESIYDIIGGLVLYD